MWTAHSGPSLFWPSKVCICFNSISMLTFNNIVRWHFYTHRVRLMLQMMPPSLSFVFFSSSHLSLTATAQLRNEWWVYSLSYALITAKRFLLSVSSALTIRRTLRWTFCKERLARKDTWKFKFKAARFEPSILFTFYHWKVFCWYQGLNPCLLPYHAFDAFTVNQHWCRNEIRDW
jgi:hypothetical protein